MVVNGEGRLTTKLVAETCCMEKLRLRRWERKRYRLERVRDDGMAGREEAEVEDIFIHLEGGKEVRVKGRSDSESCSKSWWRPEYAFCIEIDMGHDVLTHSDQVGGCLTL